MNDMIGQPVEPGDWLIDDRGKVFQAQPTDRSIQIERIILTRERRTGGSLGPGHYLHLQHSLLVADELLSASPRRLRTVWQAAYEKFVRPQQQTMLAARKAEFRKRKERIGK